MDVGSEPSLIAGSAEGHSDAETLKRVMRCGATKVVATAL
jgi:hypothetical protein